MKKIINILFVSALALTFASEAGAARLKTRKKAKSDLEAVCPTAKRRQIGTDFFYKNNKPIRASSAINAPVIGNNPVMTLAAQAGKGRGLFGGRGYLYATDGTLITSMTPYPCRSDHCGGRIVSSMQAATARRAAIKANKSPAGYIKIAGNVCVYIPDLGACFGGGVDKSRPLCDRTLK
jgi:hypothetical protein